MVLDPGSAVLESPTRSAANASSSHASTLSSGMRDTLMTAERSWRELPPVGTWGSLMQVGDVRISGSERRFFLGPGAGSRRVRMFGAVCSRGGTAARRGMAALGRSAAPFLDRKSTRLNSSHVAISYAVFCLKKKKKAIVVDKLTYDYLASEETSPVLVIDGL